MSRTIASLMVALVGLAGGHLSDTLALEIAGHLLSVGGILGAWAFRYGVGDIGWFGLRQGDDTHADRP